MDYETLCNCFIGVFVHHKDDSVSHTFVIHGERNDFRQLVAFLQSNAERSEFHISYNGLEFDAQISQYILVNCARLLRLTVDQLVKDLYRFAQQIISAREEKGFLPYMPSRLSIGQIDLFKMNHWDNKAKMSSLKWIQYSMDWQNVEEMPHPHNVPVENQETLKEVIDYCFNDVLSTKEIFKHSREQIALRRDLTREYGINLYSASEPRISRELFLHFLEQKTGIPKEQLKEGRTPRRYIILAECILPYVEFKTPEFREMHEFFIKTVVTSTKDKVKHVMKYRGVETVYGLGGVHGATREGIYEAKDGWTIISSDVVSFYPNLAIKNKFAPEHLPKDAFCELYEWIFEERKKIPKSNPKNYVYKIILNSTYGLSSEENSFLYDPKMTMQITVNGQLLLSMLYERICEEIPTAIPLMQNTDGLEMMIPTSEVDRYMKICADWERMTELSLEHDQYSKMIIRDVNNYIAVSTSGKVKCKGAFEWEDQDKKKVSVLHKNKSFLIIPKAIYAYFVHGTSPEDYLKQNTDILDYCAGVKSKSGWWFENHQMVDGQMNVNKLQKIVRYFVSSSGGKIVKKHHDGREIQVEAGPWLQTIMNKHDPDVSFEHYDINRQFYLESIHKQIDQIRQTKPKSFVQLSLF